ncbi:radical SAM protein [Clostridium botulinum]|nr:radical SAM protein [Clostridium botulinum]
MFIDNIMNKIWEPDYLKYSELYTEAMKLEAAELYNKVCNEKMGTIKYPGLTMNLLATSGCPHRFKDDRISGCSMCNYQSDFVLSYAAMRALRKKDVNLYAKAVKNSFINVRGTKIKANAFELITGNDSFSEEEFPKEILDELFLKEKLFVRAPYKYIMEVRASSVTNGRLELMKKYLGPKARVLIEFGLETGDDWLRNNWINKNVTNEQIEKAVELIHEQGFKVAMDIIIGIPGLTEEQSVEVFKKAVLYADSIGADEIICLPLNRKEGTLQGFLHDKLKDNENLKKIGLVNDEKTGVPWLFTIMEAIYQVVNGNNEIIKKLNFAQLSKNKNLIANTVPYNSNMQCDCNYKIIDAITELKTTNNIEDFKRKRKDLYMDSCYVEYKKLVDKQKACGNIKNTISKLGREISMILWPENWEDYYQILLYELG